MAKIKVIKPIIRKKQVAVPVKKGAAPVQKAKPSVPYHHKPPELSLEEWQVALRKQFVETHSFGIEKLGREPVFSDYKVTNSENRNSYKVSLRDNLYSMNFCSCLDFKTNRLGTCKHIQAVIRMIESKPKLKKLYQLNHQPDYTSVYLNYQDDRKVKIRIGETSKRAFGNLAMEYFNSKMELKASAIPTFEQFLKKATSIDSSFRCYPDALEYVLQIRDFQKRLNIINKKYLPYLDNGKFDGILKTKLFNYQKQGVCFAVTGGRTLIADDMGLGKTIQAIATAEVMVKELNINNILVVCPTSLKYQWKTEIEKFTDSKVTIVEGGPLVRIQQYKGGELYKIVSYHALVNDLKEISELRPDLIILDEAQRIKNFHTKMAQSVKKIDSPYAIVLTGTPLENKLEELYSIIQFVDPFMLGPFYRFLAEHQVTDDKGKIIGYKGLNKIGEALSGIMIRRKKKEVLDQLPERMDKVLLMDVTPEQSRLHDEFANGAARIVAKWRALGHLSEQDRQRLLILLNQMRMVCNSTYLIDQQSRNDTKIEEVLNIIEEIMNEGEEKLVIFSQWERMTRLVARELEARGIGFEYLHGGIPGSERGKLFENFTMKANSRVFLSTDAGGVGLNLQAGSVIVNLDIPWNPAILEQRIGRVHRLGQKHSVTVINMVSAGTIEHRMLDLLKFKSSMAAGILDGGEDAIFMGESRFKKFMATVGDLVQRDEHHDRPVTVAQEEIREEIREEKGAETQEGLSQPAAHRELITKGMDFLTSLATTLSKPESLKQLTETLVTKDPSDGRTYVKIPVESQQVVEQFLGLFAGLFNAKK
ncbi:MAG: DEAD/DEAH box helicase [Bacteroidales bacterium]|nr:DEAD/DEAH box helicase [Bacteroidales bacterium]